MNSCHTGEISDLYVFDCTNKGNLNIPFWTQHRSLNESQALKQIFNEKATSNISEKTAVPG